MKNVMKLLLTIPVAALLAANMLAAPAAAPAAKPAAPLKVKPKGETVITANKLEYDYQEAVVLFEDNVKVQDPQFTMTADRVFVFMQGTNDVRQVRALGNVVLVSEGRSARCAQAVYTRADGRIVMTGDALLQRGKDQIWGKEIIIWVDDQRMECRPARMIIAPQTLQGESGGRLLP